MNSIRPIVILTFLLQHQQTVTTKIFNSFKEILNTKKYYIITASENDFKLACNTRPDIVTYSDGKCTQGPAWCDTSVEYMLWNIPKDIRNDFQTAVSLLEDN